jgi:hypothetical protein
VGNGEISAFLRTLVTAAQNLIFPFFLTGNFLLTTASRPVLGPTQPRMQRVPGALSLGVKRPGPRADYSHPSNAEVKNASSYTSTPPIRLHGVVLS